MAKSARRVRQPRKRHIQTELVFRTWGGKRKGAGRKPKGPVAGMSHRRRPALAARHPAHVTVRMMPHVWNLRSRRSFTVIRRAIIKAAVRFETRLCEFSVQGNHLHLVVEAADQWALGRAMKGLGVRLARGLNKLMDGRRGRVIADRYHAHILRTPTEVRHAVHYVLHNFQKHARERGETMPARFVDFYSSASPEHDFGLPAGVSWPLRECHAPDGVRRFVPDPGASVRWPEPITA